MKDEDIEGLASSASEVKDFMESFVWKDMKGEIEAWLERVRDALEDPDNKEDAGSTENLRGSAKALRRVLALPGVMMDALMEERDDSRHSET